MELTVAIEGGDPGGDLRSLLEWLRREDRLHGVVRPVGASPVAGEMGVEQVLAVGLEAGPVAVALAGAVSVWLRHRTSDVKVVISSDRGTIRLDARRAKDVAEVVTQVKGLLGDESSGGTDPTDGGADT